MIPEQVFNQLDRLPAHPTYLYDLDGLEKHVQKVKTALGKVEVLYAAKANPDPRILQAVFPHVDGFEVASGGELSHVYQHFPQVSLAFGGPAKLTSDLKLALEKGIQRIHVESPAELQKLALLARELQCTAHVLLRANLNLKIEGVPLAMGGRPSPFGMDETLLESCLPILKQHPELHCHGIHAHLASGLKDAETHLHLLSGVMDWFRGFISQHQLDWQELNLGGGMGVDYQTQKPYDWHTLGEGLHQVKDLKLRIEPGRSLVASCGYYATPILDIKSSHGETFVIVQGGTHHFRTPAAQNHSHPFQIKPMHAPEVQNCTVNVVGQLCTPKDRLSTAVQVQGAAVGDWVVFPLAGGYAWNISHTAFLMHPEPNFVYLQNL